MTILHLSAHQGIHDLWLCIAFQPHCKRDNIWWPTDLLGNRTSCVRKCHKRTQSSDRRSIVRSVGIRNCAGRHQTVWLKAWKSSRSVFCKAECKSFDGRLLWQNETNIQLELIRKSINLWHAAKMWMFCICRLIANKTCLCCLNLDSCRIRTSHQLSRLIICFKRAQWLNNVHTSLIGPRPQLGITPPKA